MVAQLPWQSSARPCAVGYGPGARRGPSMGAETLPGSRTPIVAGRRRSAGDHRDRRILADRGLTGNAAGCGLAVGQGPRRLPPSPTKRDNRRRWPESDLSSSSPGGSMTAAKIVLPEVPYQPQDPARYQPAIGLIGCGAITAYHLTAYQAAGYRVTAVCDIHREAAEARQREYYPQAQVYSDYRQLLADADIEVVDVATHPDVRASIVRDALLADKHVLSQKPFVVDLGLGRELIQLAKKRNVKLAVNQNGRWAPHFSYLRRAIAAGMIGEVLSVHMAVHWNHGWVRGTEFEKVRHLILYDFAIHWFDMLTCFMGNRAPTSVYATTTRSTAQQVRPRLLAQVLVQYERAQASLVFDGDTRGSSLDTTFVAGSEGTLSSRGEDLNQQTVTLAREGYRLSPTLVGRWFPDGFHGTMGELLSAIEEQREPEHSGADNLRSLQLCFAAVESAETGQPVVPDSVDRLAPLPPEP